MDAKVNGIEPVDGETCLNFDLKISKATYKFCQKKSDYLKAGSLMLITDDYFQSYFVGVVKNSECYKENSDKYKATISIMIEKYVNIEQ